MLLNRFVQFSFISALLCTASISMANELVLTCPNANTLNIQLNRNWQQSGASWMFTQAIVQIPAQPQSIQGMMGIRTVATTGLPADRSPRLTFNEIRTDAYLHNDATEVDCVYQIHNATLCDDNCLNPTQPNTATMPLYLYNFNPGDCYKVNNQTVVCATAS